MRIILLIETVSREMASKFLLAEALLNNNNEVILGNTHEMFFQLLWVKHDILFLTNGDYSREKITLLKILKKRGTKIILLENEGGIFQNINQQYSRLSKDVLDFVDIYFTWGELIKEFVLSKSLISPNKIVVSGSPFFDTLLPENNYVHDIFNNTLQLPKKYILINTRFSLANESVIGQYKNITTKEEIDFDSKLIEYFIELAILLSKNYYIVFRPHPSENMDFYVEKFLENSNILVTRVNSAQFWINNCECLIHNGCTTGIEGILAGKKVISYMPIRNDKFDMHLPNSVSIICRNYNEIIINLNKQNKSCIIKDTNYEISKFINNFIEPSIPIIVKEIKRIKFVDFPQEIKIQFNSCYNLYKKAIITMIKHTNLYFFFVKFFKKYYIEHKYQESKRTNFYRDLCTLTKSKKIKVNKLFNFKYCYILSKIS
jgi:surface carbohydrate biosynthesis protein